MRRKRHQRRGGQKGSKTGGAALSSLRGGFRSVARGVTGTGPERPTSRSRRVLGNVITVVLLLVAAALIGRRFGAWR